MEPFFERDCPFATEADRLIKSGQPSLAKRLVAEFFRNGQISDELALIAADLLDPVLPVKRGRPRGSRIALDWWQIGSEYDGLRSNGHNRDSAVNELSLRYSSSTRNIEKIVDEYTAERRDGHAFLERVQAEFDAMPEEEKHAYFEQMAADVAADEIARQEEFDASQAEGKRVNHRWLPEQLDATDIDCFIFPWRRGK